MTSLLVPTLVSATQPAWAASSMATVASGGCVNPVASWSIASRLNQLMMVSGQFSDLGASGSLASAGVGGFVLYGQPAAGSGPSIQSGLAALAADAGAAGQVHPWMSTDEEGGNVARLANVLGPLPSARQMAAQWSPARVQSSFTSHGSAMRSLGVTMDLAPVLDTANPTNTIADENDRSFSESGPVAASYGLAAANGLRSSGIVPVVKHFPGLGHASANTDQGPATDPALSVLEANDLIPFEQAVSAGLPVVMVGHPSVPGLTGGLPASLAAPTYQYLRNKLHFGGVTMTDSLAAGAISSAGYSQASAAVAAIEAGADMVMIGTSDWQPTLAALDQAQNSGALSLAVVNASVTRIVAAKGSQLCPAGWTSLGGLMVGGPAVASWSTNRLDVFIHGIDNALWHRWWTGSNWSGWEFLGGQLTADPTVVSWGPNRLDVFIRGTDSALWHKWWDGTAWSSWERLGGVLAAAPEVASWAPNRLDVFVRGIDDHLWHLWWAGNGWSTWETDGGDVASSPGAVSWGPDRIDVFTTDSHGALQHLWWDGTAWLGWQKLDGILTSSPEAASSGDQHLDIYALGLGAMLYHRTWNGLNWSAWEQADNQFWTADPGAVVRRSGPIDLFERGADGALWFREKPSA
ncbi:MAG: glycoside hydrolase family 3 N-terminal domain-containing protein [Candidatus Dormibacter sp.]